MSPAEVRAALRTQPFEPFRIVMSSGSTYDVNHPENVLLGSRFVHLGIVDLGEEYPDSVIRLDLLHVTEIVPRVMPRKGGGNGQQK